MSGFEPTISTHDSRVSHAPWNVLRLYLATDDQHTDQRCLNSGAPRGVPVPATPFFPRLGCFCRHCVLAPFMIHEAFPYLTETASDSHPCCVVSVTYDRPSYFHGGNTGSNPSGEGPAFEAVPRVFRSEPGCFERVETPPRLKRLLRKKVGTETTRRRITAAAMPPHSNGRAVVLLPALFTRS